MENSNNGDYVLSSTLREIDPDTAYVVCISISLGFLDSSPVQARITKFGP